MARLFLPVALIVALPLTALADDPLERAVAVQKAIAAAEQYLAAGSSAEAVAVLEPQVSNADGSRAFLAVLRKAYAADLKAAESAATADPARVARARKMVALLGPEPAGPMATLPEPAVLPVAAAAPAADGNDVLRDARALFKQGRYADAAAKFAAAVAAQAPVTADEAAAWAYCRVKVAADAVNNPACDAAAATAAEGDVAEALKLAPTNAELQKVGQSVMVVARQRKANPGAGVAATTVPGDFETVETESFRVRHKGSREQAEAVARAAEAKRKEIFERWSGLVSGVWQPKCEIVLHPSAACYAKMMKRPADETGHATVRFADGRVSERRIELRADDAGAVANALPRELTHVVLADLFPAAPPPKWAEEGMAVLAGSPDEVSRYVRTLPRCARDGELFAVAALLEMKDFPAAKITGFYCESVSLTEYLVKLGGERNFTLFLRDCQRYGTASALKRSYNIDGPQALEQAWKRATPEAGR